MQPEMISIHASYFKHYSNGLIIFVLEFTDHSPGLGADIDAYRSRDVDRNVESTELPQ